MKPFDYPIVRYYLEQAEKLLGKESYLGVLLVAGTLSELIVREIADDDKTRLAPLLKRLLKSRKINPNQFNLFDAIRKIRNRYVHININKLANDFDGIVLTGSDGVTTFLNEIILSSHRPEKKVVEFFKIRVKVDSLEIVDLLNKAICTF